MKFITLEKYKNNLKVLVELDNITLFSYDTPIISIAKNGTIKKVYKNYDYSTTTVKHLNYFLQDFNCQVKNKKELEKLSNFLELLEK